MVVFFFNSQFWSKSKHISSIFWSQWMLGFPIYSLAKQPSKYLTAGYKRQEREQIWQHRMLINKLQELTRKQRITESGSCCMAGEQFGNVYASVSGIVVMLMFCMNWSESIVLDQLKQAAWSVSWWLMGNGAHMPEDWQHDRQTHKQLGRNPWFPGIKSATMQSKSRAPRSKTLESVD